MGDDWFNNNEGLTGKELIKFIQENQLEDKKFLKANGCSEPMLMTSIEISSYSGNVIIC